MGTKSLIGIAALIILAAGAYFYSNDTGARGGNGIDPNSELGLTTSGMRAEENMVVVVEQKPGTGVIGSIIHLAAPGYLVIHEDMGGEPGAVIGSSTLLPAGESTGVMVALTRASKDGETLYAMLHFEKGGNTTFSAPEDTPVPSILGGSIHGIFEISADAPTDTPAVI